MAPDGSDDWDDANEAEADDANLLDALDFGTPVFDDDPGLDAPADHLAGHDFDHGFEESDGSGAIRDEAEPEEEQAPVVQAINPPGTVAVSAYLNGAIVRVDLDPKVTTLTEAQLAGEICFVAGVAAKRATAVLHGEAVNMLVEEGMDFREARYFVETNMPYATPEQAGDAERALVARHYDE